jgi:hypothetical protein
MIARIFIVSDRPSCQMSFEVLDRLLSHRSDEGVTRNRRASLSLGFCARAPEERTGLVCRGPVVRRGAQRILMRKALAFSSKACAEVLLEGDGPVAASRLSGPSDRSRR